MSKIDISGTWNPLELRLRRNPQEVWSGPHSSSNSVTFFPDGTWHLADGSSRGHWETRAPDNLWLDAGTPKERIYRISWEGVDMIRQGPYRADGRWFGKELYRFRERRAAATTPRAGSGAAIALPAARTPLPEASTAAGPPEVSVDVSLRAVTDDWRDSAHEEWRRTGWWSRWLGGGRVSSSRDPDDWEHPHNK